MLWLQENYVIAVVGLVVAIVLLWFLFGRKRPDEIETPVAPPAEPKKPLEAVKPEIIAAEPARFKPKEPVPAPVAATPPPPAPAPVAEAPPAPAGFDPWAALRLIGYPLDDRAATVRAFRNHYRGQGGTVLDAEDLRILHALTSGPDANH